MQYVYVVIYLTSYWTYDFVAMIENTHFGIK